jgi:hypothetical protein
VKLSGISWACSVCLGLATPCSCSDLEWGFDMGDPDYGMPDDFRLRVIRRANKAGPVLAAAEYNVGLSTVYMWIKKYQGVIA